MKLTAEELQAIRRAINHLDERITSLVNDACEHHKISDFVLLKVFARHIGYVLAMSSGMSLEQKVDLVMESIQRSVDANTPPILVILTEPHDPPVSKHKA
jgi:hypothetical protein